VSAEQYISELRDAVLCLSRSSPILLLRISRARAIDGGDYLNPDIVLAPPLSAILLLQIQRARGIYEDDYHHPI